MSKSVDELKETLAEIYQEASIVYEESDGESQRDALKRIFQLAWNSLEG